MPVFDANVALGRRQDRRVPVDTPEETLAEMDRAGVQRALVYAHHASSGDARDDNDHLLGMIGSERRLVPQFVFVPGLDDLDSFADKMRSRDVRALRTFPRLRHYPFRDWVLGPWLEWMADERIPLWLPANYNNRRVEHEGFDPVDVYDTLKSHPGVNAVLAEVTYTDFVWAMAMLRSLPNVYIELSRFVIIDAIPMLVDAIGAERVLFGSRFPDSAMATQLYALHRCGLGQSSLKSICSGNLERLLRMD